MLAAPQPDLSISPTDHLQQLIDSIEIDGIYMLDCDGRVLSWNRGAELNKGYSKDEILGKHFRLFFLPEDMEAGLPETLLAEAVRAGRQSGEGWRLRKDGTRFWASFVLTAMFDAQGAHIGFSKVIRDLTERKRHEDALEEERDRFRAAAESSLDALFLCEAVRDVSGEIVDFVFTFLNSNVQKLVTIPQSQLLGGRMCELLPVNRTHGFFEKYRQVLLTGEPLVLEFEREEDELVKGSWLRVQAVRMRDGVAITVCDITERKRNEQQIAYLAHHDSLTGLLSRSMLHDRIDQAIARAARNHCLVGVVLIDLDGFKQVNDNCGHAVGDELLCIVSRRFGAILRGADSLLRIGGDEFVAVLPDIQASYGLGVVVSRLVDSLRTPVVIGAHELRVSCSIGVAIYPETGLETAELLRNADSAMYAAKRAGKNQHRAFSAQPAEISGAILN